ncbi:MAG: hypothetical protein JWM31_1356 [Solirubrobacterales bacterium]|nr:hypothetical protein [Solirubrobacterales bacterium]
MAASVSEREAAREAWWMGTERAARPLTANELHTQHMAKLAAGYESETVACSDWLLSICPALRTPGGLACGFAIEAAKALKRQHPEWKAGELFRAVLAYRNGRLAAMGAADLIVEPADAEAVAA